MCVIDLAVVLISRNQEWNIARLVESVIQETHSVPSREIVLVDSASTDRTIDVARSYPTNILRLRLDQPLTPAAGRYVGYQRTRGDLVLFLDGDMELYPGWLERAIRVIQNRPDVAAVTGRIIDLPKKAALHDKPPLNKMDLDGITAVPFAGGAALYRRSVLEQVGTFNPYFFSDEEPELCLRIRHAGYHILQYDHPIAYHYTNPNGALSTLVGRWRRNLFLGYGQIIRSLLGNELLWPYLAERGYGCAPAVGLAIGLIAFLWSLMTQRWTWFGLWVLLVVAVVIGDACRKRSLYRAIYTLVHRMFIVDGTVRGLLSKSLDPTNYPGKVDVIK